MSSVILIEYNSIYIESDAVFQSLRDSVRLGPGLRCYGLFPVQRAMPATVSSSAIGTNGSAELKSAKSHQRTSGRDSSNEPAGTRSSSCHVLAEHDWRRIVILRFFVAATFASNPEKFVLDALFVSAPVGTKGVLVSHTIGRRYR
jgi:hypothetical protein